MKVFLIDDSAQVFERLLEMLAPLPGVQVIGHAADIPEALLGLRTAIPDVVLLDLHLPSGSGIELLEAIKREMPATLVIVLTNYAFPQYKQKCLELGAHAFLDKSTDFTVVPEMIWAIANPDSPWQGFPPPSLSEAGTKVGSR
jgi:DNA-binding NarL/FixJ family response regulator